MSLPKDLRRANRLLEIESKGARLDARSPDAPSPNPVLEEIRRRRIALREIPDLPRGPQPDGSYVTLDGSVLTPLARNKYTSLCACTPNTAGFIIDEVAKGRPLSIAAALAGRHPETILNWIHRGADGTEPYASFAFAAARARAAWAAWISDRIALHIERDWAAGSFLLQRTFPEVYARKDSNDHALNQSQSNSTLSPILIAILARNKQPDALPPTQSPTINANFSALPHALPTPEPALPDSPPPHQRLAQTSPDNSIPDHDAGTDDD